MKLYPSIGKNIIDADIMAFDKIDGSNIRAEWTRKNSFNKYGSRKRLMDETDLLLGEAISIFENSCAEELEKIFIKNKYQKMTIFFEYYGDNSFAGNHVKDEEHYVKVFDLFEERKGFLLPQDFIKTINDKVPTAELLYRGKPNVPFVHSVKTGTLEGMTFEGVVCKGVALKRNRQLTFKIKNEAWLDKVRAIHAEGTPEYEDLA